MDRFSDNLTRYANGFLGGGMLGFCIGGHIGAGIGVAIGVISACCATNTDSSSVASSQGTQMVALKNRKSLIGRFSNLVRRGY